MTDGQPTDVAELLERARGGDAAAREELFAVCRGYLGLAARAQVETWLRRKVDASDVIQQTMLEVHTGFDRFAGGTEKEWLAWVKQILAHNVADFVRHYRGTAKRQVGREVPFCDPSETGAFGVPEPAGRETTPSQELVRLDDELKVTAALAQLPPDYREVILLRNLERLPFNEVADRMGRSRPAVQMLWMRALKKLETLLASP